ncbi:DUF4870 domain-containing protein [Actinoplanes sp. NPDC051343]|uniref:DUF4870 domain-containing protein n=1 Tax=Actinoplanes sp. NPDC051343 TaxID=3363906 RepID=UPI0037B930F8
MSEPPRPPGNGMPDEPTSPYNPPPAGGYPPPPPPPPYGSPPPYGNQPPPYGSQSPPYGGQQPPYGGQPQYGGYPGNNAAGEDRTWLLVAHFGGAAGALISGGTLGWIAPLIAMLSRGPQSPHVRAEAVKALNFQLVIAIVAVVCWLLSFLIITILVGVAATILGIVFGVIAGAKAANGEGYNYPLNVTIVK